MTAPRAAGAEGEDYEANRIARLLLAIHYAADKGCVPPRLADKLCCTQELLERAYAVLEAKNLIKRKRAANDEDT